MLYSIILLQWCGYIKYGEYEGEYIFIFVFFLLIDIFKQKIAYMIFGSYLYWIVIDLKLV